jgi:hypothetical protein
MCWSISRWLIVVFAGVGPGASGTRFVTGWQLWKQRNHCDESFVLEYVTPGGEVAMLFRTSDGDGDGGESHVRFVEIDEEDLPDGVAREGVTVRDER